MFKIHLLLLITFLLLLVPNFSIAKRDHYEKWYQPKWCLAQSGKSEVPMEDKTRCDCPTDNHAIEFDFRDKWAEAIGQSLYYSIQTGKKPGVVLILEEADDYKYWIRLNSIIDLFQLDITTWKIGQGATDD